MDAAKSDAEPQANMSPSWGWTLLYSTCTSESSPSNRFCWESWGTSSCPARKVLSAVAAAGATPTDRPLLSVFFGARTHPATRIGAPGSSAG